MKKPVKLEGKVKKKDLDDFMHELSKKPKIRLKDLRNRKKPPKD